MAQNNMIRTIVLCGTICVLILSGCAKQQQQYLPLYDTVNVVENTVIDENSVPLFPK